MLCDIFKSCAWFKAIGEVALISVGGGQPDYNNNKYIVLKMILNLE